jgi:hypothetical protein
MGDTYVVLLKINENQKIPSSLPSLDKLFGLFKIYLFQSVMYLVPPHLYYGVGLVT